MTDMTYLTLSEVVPSTEHRSEDPDTVRARLTDLLELRDRARSLGLTDHEELYTDAIVNEMLGGRVSRAARKGRAA